jgi:hypothetical protein
VLPPPFLPTQPRKQTIGVALALSGRAAFGDGKIRGEHKMWYPSLTSDTIWHKSGKNQAGHFYGQKKET